MTTLSTSGGLIARALRYLLLRVLEGYGEKFNPNDLGGHD